MIACHLIVGSSSSFRRHSVVAFFYRSILSSIATNHFHNRVLLDPPRVCFRFELFVTMQFHHLKSTFTADLKHVDHFLHNFFHASTVVRNCCSVMCVIRNRYEEQWTDNKSRGTSIDWLCIGDNFDLVVMPLSPPMFSPKLFLVNSTSSVVAWLLRIKFTRITSLN